MPARKNTSLIGMRPRFFKSGADFRGWLDAHHDRAPELLVGFYKKSSGRGGLSYQEALDEALAYGWIDGLRKNLDAERWTIRFTPRKPRSIWSSVNTKRVGELMALDRMTPAGMRAFEARDPKRSGIYGHERKPMTFDAAIEKTFAANKRAKAFFDAQPRGYKKILTYWVMSAKKEETRLRRLDLLIDRSARGKRIDFMKRNE
jgi:uncharacterized protein YdeI (YjbR/CyaY-like superfamily)